MTDPEHDVYDDDQAAVYLSTSNRHLRRLRQQGLRSVRIGGKVRYLRADLDRFIDDAAQQSHSA